MKFARALVVATVVAACFPLAAACGSAPDPNLFSSNGFGNAGANSAHAGSSAAAGKDGAAGASNGSGGRTSGDGGESNSSSGAPASGMSSGGGGDTSDAGEAGEGSGGTGAGGSATGGASMGGAGGTVAGGASVGGVGAGGAGAGGASPGSAGAGGASLGGASMGGAGTGAGGTGAGGTSVGGASMGGAGAGGAALGGASAGGAALGGAGSGGAGGADGCPVLAPTDKTECNVSTPSSCFYAGKACSCLAAAGPGPATARKWACYGTPEKCPSTKPTAGNSCKQNIGAECPYPNQDYCTCKGTTADASWVCQSPSATCLTNKPPQNLACGPVRTCQYSDVSCFCNASNWSCLGG